MEIEELVCNSLPEEVVCNDLPEEVLLMILGRLPTRKCYARMKTVCTRWNELLSCNRTTWFSKGSFLFQFEGTGKVIDKVQSWVMEGN
ncbi:hypothetical protein KI387_037464, partial [Taxus chinensis]